MRSEWFTRAKRAVVELSLTTRFLTSDDVRDEVGIDPTHWNQVGALMRECVDEGLIIPTGHYVKSRRPAAKKRTVKIFRSARWTPDGDPVKVYEEQRGAQESML